MILWLNPTTGLSGDMLLGALLGLGAPVDAVRESIASIGLTGWSLSAERVKVDGIGATRAVVAVDDDAPERHASALIELASRAKPDPVATMAVSALESIARVEGALHDRDPAEVHLHEVGGLDTIVDTVGVAAAVHALGITAVHSAPIALGSGTVRCAHGVLPAPAPATARLLEGAVVVGSDLDGETVTPTGAALVSAMGVRFTPPPAMTLGATAFGAGTKRFPQRPNVLSASLATARSQVEAMVVVECTVDDVTGETLGYVLDRLLDAGAADAWTSPVTMKKARPAHVLHVLCAPAHEEALTAIVLAETGTLGVRRHEVQRTALPRRTSTVSVAGHSIRVKHGPHRSKPEHDDVAAAARALGLPLRAVAERACEAAGEQVSPS